jgi:hypothetical protein
MERFPSVRGPNSMRPWNQPSDFSSTTWFAARWSTAGAFVTGGDDNYLLSLALSAKRPTDLQRVWICHRAHAVAGYA